MAVLSVLKSLNRVEKSLLCGREQCQPEGFTVLVNCCVIFVWFG